MRSTKAERYCSRNLTAWHGLVCPHRVHPVGAEGGDAALFDSRLLNGSGRGQACPPEAGGGSEDLDAHPLVY